MGKQFKFKIKNSQIADAINLSEVKKKLTKKTNVAEEKKAEVVKEEPAVDSATEVEEESAPPKRRAKARSRSVFAETPSGESDASEETVLSSSTEEEEASIEPATKTSLSSIPTLHLPSKANPEGLKKLQENKTEVLGPTGRHIKDLIPPAPPKRAEEAKEKKTDEEKQDAFADKPPLPARGPKAKEFKDLKPAKKSKVQSFDSRDRQGLRADEDSSMWRRKKHGKGKGKSRGPEIPIVRPSQLKVRLPISIKDLAQEMKLKASELIAKLFIQGVVATLNDVLDDETAVELLGHEFGCTISIDTSQEEKIRITDKTIKEEIAEVTEENKTLRPPIVTFMGHVDHGKTSLIDAIRSTNTVSQEAGAITQHIGAFRCKTDVGDITILDTPGHEAFSAMRARGADVTDIVVLVVAGDEGMKQQTVEALQHAKAAGVTIVVAINKCDKPNFQTDTVYRQLADNELLPESWGGQTITVNTSAVTKEGIKELLEMLALQAEVLELKANPSARARGIVLESEMHKGMGAQATILVMNGTLKKGDAVVFDTLWGKIKTMKDAFGYHLEEASPATPVEVTGLSGIPFAGDEFIVVAKEKEAKEIAEKRALQFKTHQQQRAKKSLESLLQQSQEKDKKILNLLLRADVQGSLEALRTALSKIDSDKVEINFLFAGIGEITESDVQLAQASNAVIVGFHSTIEQHAEQLVKETGVQIRLHDIIYHAIDDVKELMLGTLEKIAQEEERGKAVVLQTFKSSQVGIIAGSMVQEGTLHRNYKMRLLREGKEIWRGGVTSLKRMKEDVKEVKSGYECGVVLEGTNDIQEGDILEAFEITYIHQTL